MTLSQIATIETVTRELNLMLTIEGDRIDDAVSSHVRNQVRALESMIQPDPNCRTCKGTGITVISLAGDEIPGASLLTTDVCPCLNHEEEAIPF